MRKLAMCGIAVGVLAVVGCDRTDTTETRTYSTPVGTVKVTTGRGESEVALRFEEGKVEVRGEEGVAGASATGESGMETVQIDAGVLEKDLGMPLYPGATVMHSSTKASEEGGAYASVSLTTSDPIEKVKQFYQEHLPGADTVDRISAEGRSVTMTKKEGGVERLVRIHGRENAGMRTITLSRREKPGR